MRARRPGAAVAALTALVLLAVACSPPSSPPAELSQVAPIAVNGMVQEGGSVWVSDLFGRQVVRFSPDTGVIEERYGMDVGVCTADDPVVVPGGDVVATCPTEGLVVRIPRGGGRVMTLANVGRGVNPIALDPSGTSVLVGFGAGDDDRLLRVPLGGGPVTTVAGGLPALNGFGFGPDGLLYVPTGGVPGLFGTGGLGRIDTARAINREIQHLNHPSRGGVALHDGTTLHVGDRIATRRNHRALWTDQGHQVRNRHTWTVTATRPDGAVTANHPERGTVTLPADYVAENVELGWAVTGYGTQGDTVDIGIAVLEPSTSGNHAYVAMTRGRHANHALLVDPTGTFDPGERLAEIITRPAATHSALATQARLHRVAGIEPPDPITATHTAITQHRHTNHLQAAPPDPEPEHDPAAARHPEPGPRPPARQAPGPSLGL